MIGNITKSAMVEILRAEGWKKRKALDSGYVWMDPVNEGIFWSLEDAYKLAHRRRLKREAANLRKQKTKKAEKSWWRDC